MKINQRKKLFTILLGTGLSISLFSQNASENVTPLSKGAHKGYLNDAGLMNDGKLQMTYKISGDKKKGELLYEQYIFDKELKFVETKQISEPKIETKPDREKTYFGAWVGGGTSFDILSMKLRLYKRKELQEWDYKKQKYVRKKVLEKAMFKADNDKGDFYYGIDEYSDMESGNLAILAYNETKDKTNPKKYLLLSIDESLKIKEIPLDLNGKYSVVFSYQVPAEDAGNGVNEGDFIIVFAPRKGSPDISKYLYLHYDIKGNLKNKVEFNSPSPNLYISSADAKGGSVYFCATSTNDKESFEEVFNEYAPIMNPNFREANNYQMAKWEKAGEKKMDNFHLLKFTGNNLDFASKVSIKDFKSKVKKSPNGGSGDPYNGKKFEVQLLYVASNGDYLIAGQLTSLMVIDQNWYKSYNDLVCLHFDSKGTLKAQYAVEKMNDDKKSSMFSMPMHFYLSKDGKGIFWEIYEIKGEMGYANWADAINGAKTFYPTFFPRVAKINLESNTIGDFKILGQKKYRMNKHFPGTFDENGNTIYYFGKDEDNEKLWVGKVILD